jgi:hypothetical protein
MRKVTLARIEIDVGLLAVAALLALAGYALISTLADRVDPKVRDCLAQHQNDIVAGKPLSHDDAVKLCKQLEKWER